MKEKKKAISIKVRPEEFEELKRNKKGTWKDTFLGG